MAADRAEIESLIRAADAAGDGDAVKVLFAEMDKLGPAAPVAEPAQPPAPEQPNTWGNAAKNVLEAGANFTTGITGGIVGDVAGLGALFGAAVGDAVTGEVGGSGIDPAAVRNKVSSALTYQPANPSSVTSKIVQAPGKMVGGAGDYLASKTQNAYAQDVLRAVPLAVASYGGVKAGMGPKFDARQFGGTGRMAVPQPVPGTPAPPAPTPTPEQVAIKTATAAGYKLSPSQVGNKVGGAVEGLSGQAASERLLSKKNVTITDNLSKKALGLDDAAQLTPAKFTELKVKANRAYSDVAKTGARKTSDNYRAEVAKIDDRTGAASFADDTPQAVTKLKESYANVKGFTAEDAVAKIRQLRKDATANFKTRDPEKMALGGAQRKVADALDNELERHVTDLGKPDLVKQYKDARVQLAKVHTVEDALQGTNVSAKKIWQQWKRGSPLQGELLTIARTYDSFQHVLQDASKIRGKHPFSVVDAFVAAGGAAINPALLATVAARPAARSALASNFYQNRFVRPKGSAAASKAPAAVRQTVAPAAAVNSRERRVK